MATKVSFNILTWVNKVTKRSAPNFNRMEKGINDCANATNALIDELAQTNNNLVSKASGVTNNIESTNNFKETVTGIKDVAGFSATSFADANFVAQAESAGNVCGYGFHIPSTIGGYIFMNGDGNLFFTNSNGKTYKINMTPTE